MCLECPPRERWRHSTRYGEDRVAPHADRGASGADSTGAGRATLSCSTFDAAARRSVLPCVLAALARRGRGRFCWKRIGGLGRRGRSNDTDRSRRRRRCRSVGCAKGKRFNTRRRREFVVGGVLRREGRAGAHDAWWARRQVCVGHTRGQRRQGCSCQFCSSRGQTRRCWGAGVAPWQEEASCGGGGGVNRVLGGGQADAAGGGKAHEKEAVEPDVVTRTQVRDSAPPVRSGNPGCINETDALRTPSNACSCASIMRARTLHPRPFTGSSPQEAITATEGFTYERPERPDLPPPATDKGDPRFKPVQTCSLTKRLSKTETVVLTSPGARVSGLMSRLVCKDSHGPRRVYVCVCVWDAHAHTHRANRNKHIQRTCYNTWTHHTRIDSMTRAYVALSRELQKATTDSSHASILSRASLQDSKGRDKPRSVAGLVKGQGLVKGSGKSSPLHPYNPTAGHDEWQGGEGRGHRDFAITAGSAAWKEEAYGAGSGDGVQEESALEEAVVSD